MKNEIKHTAHSSYRCEYHIVFGPKYRRKEIYGKLRKDIGEILRKLCEEKGVEIIEAKACPEHIHMLVSIPPHLLRHIQRTEVIYIPGIIRTKRKDIRIDAGIVYSFRERKLWKHSDFPLPSRSVS